MASLTKSKRLTSPSKGTGQFQSIAARLSHVPTITVKNKGRQVTLRQTTIGPRDKPRFFETKEMAEFTAKRMGRRPSPTTLGKSIASGLIGRVRKVPGKGYAVFFGAA